MKQTAITQNVAFTCVCWCVFVHIRPNWADCVSRTKLWGCRRRNFSSCIERRYSHLLVFSNALVCFNTTVVCILCVTAHTGNSTAVSQSGAERAERVQRCSHPEPGPAEGRSAERPAEHLQRAVQSQRCEYNVTHSHAMSHSYQLFTSAFKWTLNIFQHNARSLELLRHDAQTDVSRQ